MHIHISLDYELFLKDPGGDIVKSLIEPTRRLNLILEKHGLKAIYFVDAGYMSALNRQKSDFASLKSDYEKLVSQLVGLNTYGHEIGLHIHPHWEDTFFDGEKWMVDLKRYKLADFDPNSAYEIFKQYHAILQSHTAHKIVSYRAGGWCLEPFSSIRSAMRECGISIDSTVYLGGMKQTATHSYDFTGYPRKDIWRFEKHPSIEEKDGFFTEIPSTSYTLQPFVFWRLMLNTVVRQINNNNAGHGVKPSFKEVLTKLFFPTNEAVSIDSVKSNSLMKAFRAAEINRNTHFCVIGHPKCFTEETYRNVNEFVNYALAQGHRFSTFREIAFQQNANN
ncbi:MAG: hypothetical protein ACK5AO_06665 [bacterium]|jgi:peptidoglycan/xylan/chitin deacetylase (PgdA/CDA1 family)